MSTTVRVPVKASIWDWVMRIGAYSNLTVADHEKIDLWRSGSENPTMRQISYMSKKLSVPFGYFFLKEPVDDTPQVFAHRTIANANLAKPSRDLVDTVFSMQSIQDWARQDSRDNDYAQLSYVGSCSIATITAQQLAHRIHQVLGLDERWFEAVSSPRLLSEAFTLLRQSCEQAGILVMLNGIVGDNTHRALNPQEFRAFALVDAYDPLIFINHADSRAGQLFSLAHEVAHIWLGVDELYNDNYLTQSNAPLEVLCNATAAELLIPNAAFIQEWKQSMSTGISEVQVIAQLAKVFPVSAVTVARRALDAGFIGQAMYDKIADESLKQWEQKESTVSGGNYYNTKQSRLDHRFLARLSASISEGRTTYTQAYRLTGSNRTTFPKLLEAAGV